LSGLLVGFAIPTTAEKGNKKGDIFPKGVAFLL
jgi:hypothetical protein